MEIEKRRFERRNRMLITRGNEKSADLNVGIVGGLRVEMEKAQI